MNRSFNYIQALKEYSSNAISLDDKTCFAQWLSELIECPHCAYCFRVFKSWDSVDCDHKVSKDNDYEVFKPRVELYIE